MVAEATLGQADAPGRAKGGHGGAARRIGRQAGPFQAAGGVV